MNKRIELRGVIVPSEYATSEYMQKYITAGIITPEITFRKKLEEVPCDQPLDVYVNSPGGSIFAANEMINAVREWKEKTKQAVTVTIGAMAASAASAFAIMAADKIRAHKNAKMMFHGAWTVSLGGKDLHEDTAELLGKINADIKGRLVSKYGMKQEMVDEWFAEGREGWLSAEEMSACGISSETIEDGSDAINFPAEAVAEIEQGGIGIAALLTTNKEKEAQNESGKEGQGSGDGSVVGIVSGQGAEKAVSGGPALQPVACGQDSVGQEAGPSADRVAGREEGRAEAVAEFAAQVDALKARVDAAETAARTMQSERDKARAENEKARVQHEKSLLEMSDKLKAATDQLARFLNGGLSFSAGPSSWQEAMDYCKGDYVRAAREFPELKRAYIEKNKSK